MQAPCINNAGQEKEDVSHAESLLPITDSFISTTTITHAKEEFDKDDELKIVFETYSNNIHPA